MDNNCMRILVTLVISVAMLASGESSPEPGSRTCVGYRGDGSGIFPVSGVPTAWDVAKGTGIAWKADLPTRGLSEAVVVGDRVLVSVEPEWLYCFQAGTGALVWKTEISAFHDMTPELQEKGRALLNRIIALWMANTDGKDPAYRDIEKEIGAFKPIGLQAVQRGMFSGFGYAFSTPVSDGSKVWVRFGTGSLGCCDLATGAVLWQRNVPLPSGLYLQSTQIAVIGDSLFILEGIPRNVKVDRTISQSGYKRVTALDARTGKELWSSVPLTMGDHGFGNGLLAIRVGGKPLLAVSSGQILNPADGAVLLTELGNCNGFGNAFALPDAVCFGYMSIRLKYEGGVLSALDPPMLPKISRVFDLAVIHQDLSYVAEPAGLSVFRPADRPEVDERGRVTPKKVSTLSYGFSPQTPKTSPILPSLVGGLLYCPAADGRLAVVEPGEKPVLKALNSFPDRITAACTAGPGRLFVRTQSALYAVGR